ncbi:MAG: energy transducer TonB [Betaproteobacteria bacterium]|nr:energy transducer TonB [Betaproteobacteria bacterium]
MERDQIVHLVYAISEDRPVPMSHGNERAPSVCDKIGCAAVFPQTPTNTLMASAAHADISATESQQRTILLCVAMSLILHAAALALIPGMPQTPPAVTARVLTARLVPPVSAESTPAQSVPVVVPPTPAQPERPKPKVEPPPPTAPRPLALPTPTPATPQVASPAPVAPLPPPASTEASAPSPPPLAPSAPRASEPVPQAPRGDPAPRLSQDGTEDAGTLSQYRLALLGAAKRYNKIALNSRSVDEPSGAEIRVSARLVIGANGMISTIELTKPSRHEQINKHAVETIRKAKPLVQIPPALRNREFSVDVLFVFNIE